MERDVPAWICPAAAQGKGNNALQEHRGRAQDGRPERIRWKGGVNGEQGGVPKAQEDVMNGRRRGGLCW